VLFAGGGTGTATVLLLNQLRAAGISYRAVHFDLSGASIAIAKARARRVGHYPDKSRQHQRNKTTVTAASANSKLSFVRGSLLDPAAIDRLRRRFGSFDYIDCVGVLMATEDPDLALRHLRSLLNPHGPSGMGIMVYGTYGRAPVYQIRRAMQLMSARRGPFGVGTLSTPAQLRALRRVLTGGGNFWSRAAGINVHGKEEAASPDYYDDVSLVDTYLHPIDRSFTVPEVFAMAGQAGLRIAGFTVPAEYAGETISHKRATPSEAEAYAQEVLRGSQHLPWEERLALGELLDGTLERHEFFVVPAASTEAPPEVTECGAAIIVPRVPLAWLKDKVMPEVRERGRIVIPSTDAGHSKRILKLPRGIDRHIAGRIVTLADGKASVKDMYADAVRVFGRGSGSGASIDSDCNFVHRFRSAIDETVRMMVKAGYAVVNVGEVGARGDGKPEEGGDREMDICAGSTFWKELHDRCSDIETATRKQRLVETASKLFRAMMYTKR
jgi:SAM-dependent methyltransferase